MFTSIRGKNPNFRALRASSPDSDADRETVLNYVKANGLGLRFVPQQFKADEGVVLAARRENFHALQYASPCLLEDFDFMLAAVTDKGEAYQYASAELKDDLEFQKAAAEKNGLSLLFIARTQQDLQVHQEEKITKGILQQHSLYRHGRTSPEQPECAALFLS